MGDLIFTDFRTKDGTYTKGGGIDDLVYMIIPPIEDTAPSEMPPVQPSYTAHNDAILDRLHGVPANVEIPGAIVGGDPNAYAAPEQDPA